MFEKVIEESRLRYRWTGGGLLRADWRFVHYASRRGELYVRVDDGSWDSYSTLGAGLEESTVRNILGRASTAEKIIQQRIDEKVAVKRQPSSGNPYGRFPEDQVMAVLGSYEDMEEIDFLALSDGLGLRVLDERFIEIYSSFPEELVDEWDRQWKRVASPTAFRPWALYHQGDIALGAPDPNTITAVGKSCKLPEVNQLFVTQSLDHSKLNVIGTLNRKSFDSQNKVMKNNSANEVAKLLGLPPVGYEWLHMVAFTLGGFEDVPQTPDNLVLGTAAANTAMMILEGFIKAYMRRHSGVSARISVSRTGFPPKQGWFTTQINYLVQFSGGFKPVYVREAFDPLSTVAPTYDVKQMVSKYSGFRSDPAPLPVSDTVRKPRPGWHLGRRL